METNDQRWQQYITVDPAVAHGQACIRVTRIPVAIVLDNLAAGLSAAEILRQYPTLTLDGVRASLAYAAELTRERVVAIP